jgi:putative DNA primase/helicase
MRGSSYPEALIEEALKSSARVIACARPEIRIKVFQNQATEAASWVSKGHAHKQTIIDGIYDIAVANDLVRQEGEDVIQRILSNAFDNPPTIRKLGSAANRTHVSFKSPPAFSVPLPVLAFDVVADVEATAIDWVWEGRLARRKLTLIAGDPGLGKSQISAYVAARVSTGSEWPDQGTAPHGSIIILSAEDSVADTIRPRLEVAAADLGRIHVLRSVTTLEGSRRTFSLQSDLVALSNKVRELVDLALVIIDPITSYMGRIDSHRTTDVRAVLEPLSEFAEHHGVAVLAITHPPKATQAKALHAITGSLAFVAAARLVFIAVEEVDSDRRLLLPVKSNIGRMPPGLGFNLVQARTCSGIETSHVVWDSEPVTITANQALHAASDNARSDDQLQEAEEFLRSTLALGPVPAKKVERQAEEAGISKRTLRRARAKVGVVAEKSGFGGKWVLRLGDRS